MGQGQGAVAPEALEHGVAGIVDIDHVSRVVRRRSNASIPRASTTPCLPSKSL